MARSVRQEITDLSGKAISGFAANDCDEIYGDEIERVVSRKKGPDVSDLSGQPVRLRFLFKDVDLYNLRFGAVAGIGRQTLAIVGTVSGVRTIYHNYSFPAWKELATEESISTYGKISHRSLLSRRSSCHEILNPLRQRLVVTGSVCRTAG